MINNRKLLMPWILNLIEICSLNRLFVIQRNPYRTVHDHELVLSVNPGRDGSVRPV
jgi:hypothetical protein